MHAVWDRKYRAAQISIQAGRVLETATIEVDVPREQLWDYLLQAEHFNAMLAATKVEIVGRVGGRIGTGTVYECYHGGGVAPQLVLEWQPFERMLFQFDAPVPVRGTRAMWELRLEPSGDGTRATQTFSKPTGPILGRFFATKMLRMLAAKVRSDMASFKTHIEAVHGRNQVTNAVAISSDTIAAAARESLATA